MAVTSLSPQFHLTRRSGNKKTGPIPVSTSSSVTCPDSCPLKKVCYAKTGFHLAGHWAKVTAGERGLPFDQFLESIRNLPAGQLWRHNEAGDLPGIGDAINTDELSALVEANHGKRGFTYTHKPVNNPDNLRAIRQANQDGFTVNLSADSISEADQLTALDIGPVVVVVSEDTKHSFRTPAGHRVVICPNANNPEVTCRTCGLCQKADRRNIIAFPVHGNGKKHWEES